MLFTGSGGRILYLEKEIRKKVKLQRHQSNQCTENRVWDVFINDVPLRDYERQGQTEVIGKMSTYADA